MITTFDDEHRHLTVTAVAERTNLSRAAARRFLYTLAQLGYVRQNGRTYELGPRVLELGAAYLAGLTAPELARPYLEDLSDSVGESSHLSVLDGPEITCVAKVPVRKIWSLDIHVGTRFPAFATAAGRVLLAARSDEWLDGFLSSTDLRAITSHTTTDRTSLRRELLRIREQGWALVDQEVELQLWTVAAPVRDGAGAVGAAVSVSTLSTTSPTGDDLHRFVDPLLACAEAVEAEMARTGFSF